MIQFKIQKLSPDATLPTKGNTADAGIDIFTNETHTLQPNERHMFTTGIACAMPDGYVGLLWDRSGLGSKGIHRFAGVIDSGYRGEWKVILWNSTNEPFEIKAGDKIVQCIIQKFEPAEITEVENLEESERGEKAFGSSGR
jgi:dUTP pyrophosphatase